MSVSRRRVALVAVPVVLMLAVGTWLSSRPRENVFRVLYSEDVGKWGVVFQENGTRYLCIGASEKRLPFDGENFIVCPRERCPFSVVRSFVSQDDFPVVVRLDKEQEPAFAYRVSDGVLVWQSRHGADK